MSKYYLCTYYMHNACVVCPVGHVKTVSSDKAVWSWTTRWLWQRTKRLRHWALSLIASRLRHTVEALATTTWM